MNKGKDWFSGSADIATTQNPTPFIKDNIPTISGPTSSLPIKTSAAFSGNGLVLPEIANCDLHLVADDLVLDGNWVSRTGGFTAIRNGTTGLPNVGVESPLYPSGGWAGSGFRKATSGFDATHYYALAANSAHALTSSSTTTYEMLIRVGNISAANEGYLGKDGTIPGGNWNLLVTTEDAGGGNFIVAVRVDHATTSAVISFTIERYSYNLLTFTYNGSTQVLTVYVNGVFLSNVTGIGSIITAFSSLNIGIADTTVGAPVTTGHILEICRHQQIFSATVVQQRAQYMMGLQTIQGGYPSANTGRSSPCYELINNKLWAYGNNFISMGSYGVQLNQPFASTVRNNIVDAGTSLIQSANATITTDAYSFGTVGGQAITIPLNGLDEFCVWTMTNTQNNSQYNVSVVWRPLFSDAQGYLTIYNLTNGNYYNSSTQLWQAGAFNTSMGTASTTALNTFNMSFTTEAAGGPWVLRFIVNNNVATTAPVHNFNTYYVRCGMVTTAGGVGIGKFPSAHIITRAVNNSVSGGILEYPFTSINWTQGEMTFDFTPFHSSTSPNVGSQTCMLGSGTTATLISAISSGQLSFQDTAAHVATVSPTYSSMETMNVQLSWSTASNRISISIPSKGVSANALYTSPLASGVLRFLNSGSTQFPDGYIKNLIIRGT